MDGNDFREAVKQAEHHFLKESLFFLFLVLFSFFHDLNEKAGFAIFTDKLFIFTGV
jgi:hypothetical protein